MHPAAMSGMPRFTTPGLLRALLLGSMGLAHQACSGGDSGVTGNNSQGGTGTGGGAAAGSGGESLSAGGAHATTGGSASGSGGAHLAGGGGSSGGGVHATGGGDQLSGGADGADAGAADGGYTGYSDDGGLSSVKGCTNPMPLRPHVDTGIYTCSEGYLHRASAHRCATQLPRDVEISGPPAGVTLLTDECSRDTDCTKPNTFCRLLDGTEYGCGNAPKQYRRICEQGCQVDADCGANFACVCGQDIGTCVAVSPSSGCHVDADCTTGLCLSNGSALPLGPPSFACQLPGDECDAAKDCMPAFASCTMAAGGRTCQPGVACGRPFLVAETARLAGVVTSDAWLGVEAVGALPIPSDPALARRLADHWARIGLMEHASIAAFARFTLQLLSLGAPAELVRDSTQAQADETRHAALAFELASAYGGSPVGPTALDLRGALDCLSLEEILRTTIAEGCIGETRAALEAAEAARVASVPAVRELLQRIADDESAHSALAWRVVQWILAEHPELTPIAQAELACVDASPPAGEPSDDAAARAHGLLDALTLARVHRSAVRDVILPCASALFAAPLAA
jgi:hypothetical protein